MNEQKQTSPQQDIPAGANSQGAASRPLLNSSIFETAFRNNPAFMSISGLEDGRYIEVNEAFCKITGFNRDDVIGHTSIELGVIRQEDRDRLKQQILSDGIIAETELELVRKDKTPVFCLYHGEIISIDSQKCLLSIGINISRRKLVEETLRQSETRFRELFEGANDAIFLHGIQSDGRPGLFTEVNSEACRRLGYTREQLLRRTPYDIDAGENTALAPEIRTRILQEKTAIFEIEHVAKDGRHIPVEINTRLFDLGGQQMVLSIARDITERKRTEKEREAMIEILRLINSGTDTHQLIRAVTGYLQQWSGCEAVGIRLKDGDDYPYFETRGFPAEFVKAERTLCARDLNGQTLRDSLGNPILECMCGNILLGRFDPSKPFFTKKGSFWSNCTTELLASTSDADRQTRTRNRCNGEGYESVALVALHYADETLGLIQLNDKRRDRFSSEFITVVERMADSLAIALVQRREAQVRVAQLEELQRWYSVTLGRESRILDLKREVNELLLKAGQPPKYSNPTS